jgi:hypothetical protein
MIDLFSWKLIIPGTLFLLLLMVLMARGFGVIKLDWLNSKWLRDLKKMQAEEEDPFRQEALEAIIVHCKTLNSKWILRESDLNILENTYGLIQKIAISYHPNSRNPVEEARIRRVLEAFMELKNRLLALTAWRGVHTVTQFRIHHIVLLSRAWKLKEEWKEWKFAKFLNKYKLFPIFKSVFFFIRWLDLTFWIIRMMTYIIQDIVFKVFLVRWYLIVGDLAIQVYRDQDKEKEPEVRPEEILEDLGSMPDEENSQIEDLPYKIQETSRISKNDIIFHTWSVEWKQAKKIYYRLIEDIAQNYYPQSSNPIHEAKLFDLLIGGARFSEKIAAIQNFPFLNKLLDLKVSHAMMVKDTAEYISNSQGLAWVRKYKLTYIFKYSFLLFRVVRRGNPALLFQDFALTLASEGGKRWFYLYLHEKITIEANSVYEIREPTLE